MLEIVSGDMFTLPFDIRVNPVNCAGVMGAGVALSFKRRYSEMFIAYKHACFTGKLVPGKLHVWKTPDAWVINLPTKRHWREPSTYAYVHDGLKALAEYLATQGSVTVALPALGCGLGRLEWPKIYDLITLHLKDSPAKISVFEPRSLLKIRTGDRP